MNLYKTFCELQVSTKSTNCHYLGSGTFDFTLGQHLSFDSKDRVFIGAKNVKWPEKIRNLDMEILLTKMSSEFDEDRMKHYFVGFRNYDEFCDLVQTYANQSLDGNPNICIDISKDGNDKCFDATVLPYKVFLRYKNGRFVMDLHYDLMLVVSKNVANILGFEGGDEIGEYVIFRKNAYISTDYRSFSSSKLRKMALVVHDIIKEYCVTANGNRFSVLMNYDQDDKYRCHELLGVKELVRRDEFKQFRFCVLDEELKPFADEVTGRHLSFTLVFFTF